MRVSVCGSILRGILIAAFIMAAGIEAAAQPQLTPQQQLILERQREAQQQAQQQAQQAQRQAQQERQRELEQQRQQQAQQQRQRQNPAPGPRPQPGYIPPNQPGRAPSTPGTTYTPNTVRTVPPKPATVYVPHGPSSTRNPSAGVSNPNTGAVVYTPHAGVSSMPASPSYKAGVKTQNGVTTYTPRTPMLYPAVRPAAAPGSSPGRPPGMLAATRAMEPRTLEQINASRTTLHGINQRPLPRGAVTHNPDGGMTLIAAGGKHYTVRANGTLRTYSSATQTVKFRSNGRLASIHNPEFDIRRGPTGQRIVVSRRSDGSVLVSTASHHGYLERREVSGGRTVVRRTYMEGGKTFTRAYLGYSYAGQKLDQYVPATYYPADFYGWTYYDWAQPAPPAWDWQDKPWYQFFASYFTPDSSYPSGFDWITDFILGRTLADGYADQQAPDPDAEALAEAPPDPQAFASDETLIAQADTPITPEIKEQIDAEVKHQIAIEGAVAGGQAPPTVGEFPTSLQPNRIFVVEDPLDVSTPEQQDCSLTSGDVLRLEGAPPEGSETIDLRVASSHRADCPAGTLVNLSLADLQEMQNYLRAELDAGLAALHSDQGQGGLPSAPSSTLGASHSSPLGEVPGDPNTGLLLEAQRREAARTETAAVQGVFPSQP